MLDFMLDITFELKLDPKIYNKSSRLIALRVIASHDGVPKTQQNNNLTLIVTTSGIRKRDMDFDSDGCTMCDIRLRCGNVRDCGNSAAPPSKCSTTNTPVGSNSYTVFRHWQVTRG
jgi:hypothetical protein